MKFIAASFFIIGLAVGSGTIHGSFSTSDIVTQKCTGTKGEIVFFRNIKVAHPLGENTCGKGNLHSIPAIGLTDK